MSLGHKVVQRNVFENSINCSHAMSYEETTGFARELVIYLDKDEEDKKVIDELKEMWLDIREQRSKQQQHIKKAIQGLITLEEEELKKNPEAGKTNTADQVEEEGKLKRQMSETTSQLEKTVRECEEKKSRLNECVSEQQKLKATRDHFKYETSISLPKARYDVNLYSHITNIRWKYDCKPSEVMGYMCDKNSVRPFSFDSNQVSDFFTVNYLWDLMEEDW